MIAALYDIHGNLPALEAVLAAAAGAESIMLGGDLALGPMPRETLDRLIALGAPSVRGNCDRLVVDAFDGRPLPERLPAAVRESVAWTARQLDRAHRDYLAALPLTLTATADGLGDVLFCHATPRDDEEIFTAHTPADRVRPLLAGVSQHTVVCGHTHMQFDRAVDGTRVLNAGSVGMPFAPPGAYWLALGPDARHVRTDYDHERTSSLLREAGYPGIEQFLHPPTEAQALAMFETR